MPAGGAKGPMLILRRFLGNYIYIYNINVKCQKNKSDLKFDFIFQIFFSLINAADPYFLETHSN